MEGLGAVEGLNKKRKKIMNTDNSVVIVGEGGGGRQYRGINGTGKVQLKN